MKRIIFTLLITFFVCLFENPTQSLPITYSVWHYEVSASAGAKELLIEATLPPGLNPELSVIANAEPYLKDAEVATDKGWKQLSQEGNSWFIPAIAKSRGCRIRYRYQLAQAAQAINDIDIAKQANELILAPPSTWLMYPTHQTLNQKITFHVKTPPGISFVSGIFPNNNLPKDTYEISASSIYELCYSAFGKMELSTINLNGGKIDLAIASGNHNLSNASEEQIIKWVTKAGKAVANYYGHFPVHRALVIARISRGNSIGYGTAIGNAGAAVCISVGVNTRPTDFDEDWTITHELTHIGFPSLPRNKHAWLEEGMATYIEPIARVRIGDLTAEKVWKEMVQEMPQGRPGYGDKGLDNTPTWERIYWGGALFCLLADVEIRQKTKNRYGLEHAFRGIVAAGGTVNKDWEVVPALTEGDKAIGTSVLVPLYNQMKDNPVDVDLPNLWKRLGVEKKGDNIIFNDKAPLAHIRRAITTGKNE